MAPLDFETTLGRRNGTGEVVGSRGCEFPSSEASSPAVWVGPLSLGAPRPTSEAQRPPCMGPDLRALTPTTHPPPESREGTVPCSLLSPSSSSMPMPAPTPARSQGPGSGNGNAVSFNMTYSAGPAHLFLLESQFPRLYIGGKDVSQVCCKDGSEAWWDVALEVLLAGA